MNQYLQAITLVKIRTIAILTSLGLATSLLLAIIFSQTSHALIVDQLLPQTSAKLKDTASGLLVAPALPAPPRNPVKTLQQTPSQSTPSATQTPATSTASTAQASESAASSSQTADSLPVIDMRLQPIDFLPANYSYNTNSKKPTAHFAITSSPHSSVLLLEPTNQGWQFLGVMWYWWLAIAVGLVATVTIWKRKGEELSYQLLSWRNTTYAD